MELLFLKSIYLYKAIKIAQYDYRELCDIVISENEKYWILKFSNCLVEAEVLRKEFSNYLIEVINGDECE